MFTNTKLLTVWSGLLLLACTSGSADEPAYNFVQEGEASYYANSLAGGTTASGEPYRPDSLTAAHRHLPLGTTVLVVNPANQREVTLTVNDRGPHHDGRIIDLSRRAAEDLDIIDAGVAQVIVKASLDPAVADSLKMVVETSGGEE